MLSSKRCGFAAYTSARRPWWRLSLRRSVSPGLRLLGSQTPEIKSRLRAQTEEAITKGVFGVPSMMVGDELFWGYDDFPYLELFLAGKDPLDAVDWQKSDRPVRASSMRRRFRTNEGA